MLCSEIKIVLITDKKNTSCKDDATLSVTDNVASFFI